MKLVDAGFIWTEPHSRRLKVKVTVQAEVFNGAILQQSFVVEYVIETHMCPDCEKQNANPNTWIAAVQVGIPSPYPFMQGRPSPFSPVFLPLMSWTSRLQRGSHICQMHHGEMLAYRCLRKSGSANVAVYWGPELPSPQVPTLLSKFHCASHHISNCLHCHHQQGARACSHLLLPC